MKIQTSFNFLMHKTSKTVYNINLNMEYSVNYGKNSADFYSFLLRPNHMSSLLLSQSFENLFEQTL